MKTTEQGPRTPTDGPISVELKADGIYQIRVEHDGKEQAITIGTYNLFRLVALVALLVGLPLSSKVMKSIKM